MHISPYIYYNDIVNKHDSNIKRILDNIPTEIKHTIEDKTNILILIDGFDEVNQDLDKQIDVLNNLSAQVDSLHNITIVVASRFIKGFSIDDRLLSSIQRLQVSPLSLNKTIDFLRQICTALNVSKRIIEDLKKSVLFRDLPRNPIAAILLAKLLSDNSQEVPSNMTELYSK